MSINNKVFCAITIALVFNFTSCGGPKYLVQGLTLPPGSTEVSYDKDPDVLKNVTFPIPGTGKLVHYIRVSFDIGNDWDDAVAHFDKYMQRAGYENTTSKLGDYPGMEKFAEKLTDMNKVMLAYSKMDGKFLVTVSNNNFVADFTGIGAMNFASADCTLTVMEFESDK